MNISCCLFDHKRSSTRASFDELNQCWISECKRCLTILVRDGAGKWHEAPPEPRSCPSDHAGSLESARFTIIGDYGARAARAPGMLESFHFTIMTEAPGPAMSGRLY